MFTGIVQGIAEIVSIVEKVQARTHTIKLSSALLRGLVPGASVAHNGCCLTVTAINGDHVSFDLMKETLRLTNLGDLQPGDLVNIERAVKIGDEIGGHLMSGHIMCTAQIQEINCAEYHQEICFMLNPNLMKYVLAKGFIGVDGISLTVVSVSDNTFSVNLIPETLRRTTLGSKRQGQHVNIEFDPQTQAIVDTTERILARYR